MIPLRSDSLSQRRYAALATAIVLLLAAGWLWGSSGRSGPRREHAWPFPCLQAEGLAQHIHPLIRIVINGETIPLPAGIGIADPVVARGGIVSGSCFEPLHTHDASGVVHIETPSPTQQYTLADLIAVWRATYGSVEIHGARYPVDYTLTEFLGHPLGTAGELRVIVDGTESSAGPLLVLTRLDYCSRSRGQTPPCWPTATSDPWPPFLAAQYGTGHTVVLDYHSADDLHPRHVRAPR